jgi:hypothetical protein
MCNLMNKLLPKFCSLELIILYPQGTDFHFTLFRGIYPSLNNRSNDVHRRGARG